MLIPNVAQTSPFFITTLCSVTFAQMAKLSSSSAKKRRRENEDEDVEMADGEATSAAKKAKRKADPKFGHEFKAKVCFIRATG